jgi:hypothetical protein
MSSQLNINDLFETTNNKTLRRLETYDKILQQCHCRIKYYSKFEKTTCFFAIPEFIIGVPLFDVQELRQYVINSLKKNGFQIMYLHPNWLMIDWGKKKRSLQKVQENTQSTIKQIKSNYKPIEEYKPTGSFVYDQASMMSLEDKTKQILHVGKLNI